MKKKSTGDTVGNSALTYNKSSNTIQKKESLITSNKQISLAIDQWEKFSDPTLFATLCENEVRISTGDRMDFWQLLKVCDCSLDT